MVTYEEAQKALEAAVTATPEEFLKTVADLMPQGMIEQLWDEMDRYWRENPDFREYPEIQHIAAVAYSMGLQTGFLYAKGVLSK